MASAAAAAVAAEVAMPVVQRTTMKVPQGQNIFVYTNLHTKQTIYSLTRSLWDRKAIAQLPFAGKKSVPAHIRKDLWQPLCVLSFPSSNQGLDAYRRMREFKMLHETAWNPEDMLEKEGRHAGKKLNAKKVRGWMIQDQRANAIADMAAVLLLQGQPPSETDVERIHRLHRRPIVTLRNGKKVPAPDRPKKGLGKKATLGKLEWQGDVSGVRIHWANILDAEYAETWPSDVLHGNLQVSRYTAVWPPADVSESGVTAAVKDMLNKAPSGAEQVEVQEEGGSSKWWQFGQK